MTMIPSTYPFLTTLDGLSTIQQNSSFPITPNNKNVGINNNSRCNDNMLEQKVDKFSSTTPNMSAHEKSNASAIESNKDQTAVDEDKISTSQRSLDLTLHSRASESMKCKDVYTPSARFNLHKTMHIDTVKPHVINVLCQENTGNKIILEQENPHISSPSQFESRNVTPAIFTSSNLDPFASSNARFVQTILINFYLEYLLSKFFNIL